MDVHRAVSTVALAIAALLHSACAQPAGHSAKRVLGPAAFSGAIQGSAVINGDRPDRGNCQVAGGPINPIDAKPQVYYLLAAVVDGERYSIVLQALEHGSANPTADPGKVGVDEPGPHGREWNWSGQGGGYITVDAGNTTGYMDVSPTGTLPGTPPLHIKGPWTCSAR
ncbi:MAG: hypothetical protein QOK05_1814 [Chloroflexota bacterium]|nr:hypothetical protein [Chloroflexota bacterium]